MAATLALTAGGTSAVSAPQHAPAAAPEQTEPPSPPPSPTPESPSPEPSPSPSTPAPSTPTPSTPTPSTSTPSAPTPSTSTPSSQPSTSKSDESQKEDEEKEEEKKNEQKLDNLTEELDAVAADANVPEELKEDVTQASASLEKLLDPKAKTPPDTRDAIERTLEPLTDALKVIQDPKTSPEDRDTVEKIVKQLKIIIVDFPETPPKDWHAIGTCVEQLKVIIVEFQKLPPHIRHDLGKIIEEFKVLLPIIPDPNIHPDERKVIEGAIPPLTGALGMLRLPATPSKERNTIEKIVDQIGKDAQVIQNPTAPSSKDNAKKAIGQQTDNLNKELRKARKGLFNLLSPEDQKAVTCTADLLLLVGTGGKSAIMKATLRAAAKKIAQGKALNAAQQRAVDEARKLVDAINGCALPSVDVWLDTLREAAKKDLMAAVLYDVLLYYAGAGCLRSFGDAVGAFNGGDLLKGVEAAKGVYSKCGPAANELSGRERYDK